MCYLVDYGQKAKKWMELRAQVLHIECHQSQTLNGGASPLQRGKVGETTARVGEIVITTDD
jgi:hypothetical protein